MIDSRRMVDRMKYILRELQFYLFQLRQNVKNEQALRGAFLITSFGVLISNACFIVIWVLFSHALGNLDGWGPVQTFGALSVGLITLGLGTFLFGSAWTFDDCIQRGTFDALLTKPKSVYVRLLNSESSMTSLGEILQGVIGLIIYYHLARPDPFPAVLMFLLIPPAIIVQIGFIMTAGCVTFWLPQSSGLAKALKEMVILPTTQPISLLRGSTRLMFLTLIPALLIAGLPVELITYHAYELIAISYAVAFTWLALSVWVLKKSIRRYESGNVIG